MGAVGDSKKAGLDPLLMEGERKHHGVDLKECSKPEA